MTKPHVFLTCNLQLHFILLQQNICNYRLHGSYDALREGHLCDALVDFTGGVSEVVDLQAEEFADNEDKRSSLLDILLQEIADHSIMCFTVVVSYHVYLPITSR